MDAIINLIIEYASIPVYVVTIYTIIIYQKLGRELRIFAYFIFLSGLIELSSTILWYNKTNNFPLLHIYVAVGFLTQIWFYFEVLKKFINKKLIWTLGILFTAFTISNSIFFESIYSFNSNALTVQSVLVIILSISTYMLFINDIVKSETDIVLVKSLSWINSGLFIYYSSSLLIFYLGDFFTKNYSVKLNQYTWTIHTIFLIVMYICFFVGLWKRPRKSIS
jgi:hypothetical protein